MSKVTKYYNNLDTEDEDEVSRWYAEKWYVCDGMKEEREDECADMYMQRSARHSN